MLIVFVNPIRKEIARAATIICSFSFLNLISSSQNPFFMMMEIVNCDDDDSMRFFAPLF